MTKNIVFRDDVRECIGAIDQHELVEILVVPEHPVDAISDESQLMVRFTGGKEQIDLPILVLQYEFSAVFVWEYA